MSWIEIALIGAVLVGATAGTALIVRALGPDLLVGLAGSMLKAALPFITQRMTPEEEAELLLAIAEADRGEMVSAEEVLAKSSRFRPQCDVTIQSFQLRMSSVHRYAPPLSPLSSSSSSGSEE